MLIVNSMLSTTLDWLGHSVSERGTNLSESGWDAGLIYTFQVVGIKGRTREGKHVYM